MLRVVIDTNVIVSGILSRKGPPSDILQAWRERRFLLLTTPEIVAEWRAVLRYPHIRKKYPLRDEEIDQTIDLFEHDALLLPASTKIKGIIPADPKDEMFLACALDGQADFIVSGDHHLIDLGAYMEIPIITARQFLGQLNSGIS